MILKGVLQLYKAF